MTLIRTSILNGLAVMVRTLAAFLLNKLLAVYVGPTGYAAVGQLQNAIALVLTFAGGAVNTGVTKYTAEYHGDEAARLRVWRTASLISATASIIASLALALFHRNLANLFLKDPSQGYVFLWLAAGLIFYVFNALLLSILQGKKQVGRYVSANIGGSLVTLALTGGLVALYGLPGALVGLAINQSVAFAVTVVICARTDWFSVFVLFGRFDRKTARQLAKFAAMALVSAVAGPTAQLIIRSHLGHEFGWESAGYWEAMNRISMLFLGMVTATFSLYYLPKMAELQDREATRKELASTGLIVVAATALACLILYILRHWAVIIAFDLSFAPMERLFAWQLIGDTLKMASWLFAYLLLARAMTKAFIVIELSANAVHVALVYAFTHLWGYEAAVAAYAATYLFYGVFCAYALRRSQVI